MTVLSAALQRRREPPLVSDDISHVGTDDTCLSQHHTTRRRCTHQLSTTAEHDWHIVIHFSISSKHTRNLISLAFWAPVD